MANPLKGLADDGISKKARQVRKTNGKIIGWSIVASAALGISVVFAAPINFPGGVFFTAGTTAIPECINNTTVSLTQSVSVEGETEIDSIAVEGIPSACDGEIVSLVIYDSGSVILDEIIWTLALTSGDTTIRVVADGSSTDTSNSSSGGVSTNFPASQTDPEGLGQNLRSSIVDRIEFNVLDSARAARE